MRKKTIVSLFIIFLALFSFTKASFSKINNAPNFSHKTPATVEEFCACSLTGNYSRYYDYEMINFYIEHVTILNHVAVIRILTARNKINEQDGVVIIQLMFKIEKRPIVVIGPIIQIMQAEIISKDNISLNTLFLMPKNEVLRYISE